MHTVSVPSSLSAEQAAQTLRDKLGAGYTVTAKSTEVLTVRRGTFQRAKVTVIPDNTSTEFQVRGAGWLISMRYANERGIAKDVAEALRA